MSLSSVKMWVRIGWNGEQWNDMLELHFFDRRTDKFSSVSRRYRRDGLQNVNEGLEKNVAFYVINVWCVCSCNLILQLSLRWICESLSLTEHLFTREEMSLFMILVFTLPNSDIWTSMLMCWTRTKPCAVGNRNVMLFEYEQHANVMHVRTDKHRAKRRSRPTRESSARLWLSRITTLDKLHHQYQPNIESSVSQKILQPDRLSPKTANLSPKEDSHHLGFRQKVRP